MPTANDYYLATNEHEFTRIVGRTSQLAGRDAMHLRPQSAWKSFFLTDIFRTIPTDARTVRPYISSGFHIEKKLTVGTYGSCKDTTTKVRFTILFFR